MNQGHHCHHGIWNMSCQQKAKKVKVPKVPKCQVPNPCQISLKCLFYYFLLCFGTLVLWHFWHFVQDLCMSRNAISSARTNWTFSSAHKRYCIAHRHPRPSIIASSALLTAISILPPVLFRHRSCPQRWCTSLCMWSYYKIQSWLCLCHRCAHSDSSI